MSKIYTNKEFIEEITSWLVINYWGPIHNTLKENPNLLRDFPGFLLKPEKIIFHIGRTHIGVEYIGPERIKYLPKNAEIHYQILDYSTKECNLMEEIIGFKFNGTSKLEISLSMFNEDLFFPTNAGADELDKLNWNWSVQSMMIAFNASTITVPVNQFTRIINGRFFDATPQAGLKTRHIKWLDLIPCIYDDSNSEFDQHKIWLDPLKQLSKLDPHSTYPIPTEFRLKRLQQVNRFIEFIGDKKNNEPAITRYVFTEELRFILKMRFSAKEIYSECICEWHNSNKKAIKPDFFIVNPNGYADIIEFKLPELKHSLIVGSCNRETFSAEINSYISQTRVYRDYFDDPNNRNIVKRKFGFDVYKPKRHLIVGRRWNFDSEEWRSIAADYTDLIIHTYDDLIDGVVMQFYD